MQFVLTTCYDLTDQQSAALSGLQSQKVVTAYLNSKQLLPFGFARLYYRLSNGPVGCPVGPGALEDEVHRTQPRNLYRLPARLANQRGQVNFLLWPQGWMQLEISKLIPLS